MTDPTNNTNPDERELSLVPDEDELDLSEFAVDDPSSGIGAGAMSESDHPIGLEPELAREDSLRTARLVTVACYRKLPLFGKRQIKDALVQDINIVMRKRAFRLLAWCVMPEHVHFFTYPRVDDPSPLVIVQTIQQRFQIRVVRRWRDIGASVLDEITDEIGNVHIWEKAPQEDVIINGPEEIKRVVQLIETKPVRRGLVEDPTHWNWSSARRHAGEATHGVPLEDD